MGVWEVMQIRHVTQIEEPDGILNLFLGGLISGIEQSYLLLFGYGCRFLLFIQRARIIIRPVHCVMHV